MKINTRLSEQKLSAVLGASSASSALINATYPWRTRPEDHHAWQLPRKSEYQVRFVELPPEPQQ